MENLVRLWRRFAWWLWRTWCDPLSRLALLAGVASIVCIILLIGPPHFSTASMPQQFSDPTLNIEFIRDVEDLRLTLGDAPSQDRETMRIKTRIDFAFIAAYVALMVSLGALVARRGGWRRITGVVAAICGLAAGVFDALENLAILDILDVRIAATSEAMLVAIRQPSTIKWSLAAMAAMLLAISFFVTAPQVAASKVQETKNRDL